MIVNIDCHLDAAVAHLLLNVGGRDAGLNQQRAEGLAQIVKAEFPKPSLLRTEVSAARIEKT